MVNPIAFLPTAPGYHWAKWLRPAPGTREGELLTPDSEWSVVEVFENAESSDPEHLLVFVPGVEMPQLLQDFVWGPGPLPVPEA